MSTAVHPMLRKVAEALAWQDLSGLRARGIVAEVTPWRAFLPAARAAVQALMEPDGLKFLHGCVERGQVSDCGDPL